MKATIIKILHWIKASLEETPGRASGKSIIAAILSISFVYAYIYALLLKHFSATDFSPNQKDILESFNSSIVWLIPLLYGIKASLKTKWLTGGGDSNDNKTDDNNKPSAPSAQ